MRKTSLLFLCALACTVGVRDGSAAPAPTPANPAVTPIRTPTPRRAPLVEGKGDITPVAGLTPAAGIGSATDAKKPIGSCSQIKITAFRTVDEYDRSGVLRERESTFAKGASLAKCTYSIEVPAFVSVRFDATTTIPGMKVVISWNQNSSSTGTMLWGDSDVVFHWKLKPIKAGVLSAAPRK
jgi:hypothetical protein